VLGVRIIHLMTKLSGEIFSMLQRTPKPELPMFSVQKLCLRTRIGLMYNSGDSFLASSRLHDLHDFFANKILKFFRGNTPDLNVGGGDGSVYPCLWQSPQWHFLAIRVWI